MNTKTCPFCIEEIKAEAIKCRYCHEAVHPGVMARLISKNDINNRSQNINNHLSAKNPAAAKVATQELVMAIKVAPNGAAFYDELLNALQAFKALGGTDTEIQTAEEKAKKAAASATGAQWGVGVALPLSLFGIGTNQ